MLARKWIKTFLVLMGCCALVCSAIAAYSMYQYVSLKERAWAETADCHILELSSSRFALEVSYTFSVGQTPYKGMTRLAKPYFLNKPSAEAAVQELHSKHLIVHFDPKNPQCSSLQYTFPFKRCVYALFAIGIAFYFLVLDRMLLKQRLQNS